MNEGKILKRKLEAGKVCFGTWVSFTDPCLTELLGGSGFDFLLMDPEHSPMNIETIQLNIMATKGSDTVPIIRMAWNDPVLIKFVLDAGAGGVLAPMVCSADEARRAVAACKYPPAGIRGFGPRRPSNYSRIAAEEYIKRANEDLVILVQIEHIKGVENIKEILAVPGLCGIFIGANDLSGSMGLLGQPGHPKVVNAIDTILAEAKKAGIPAGLCLPAPEEAQDWVNRGVQFMTLSEDMEFLTKGSQDILENVKKILKSPSVVR